MTPVCIGGEHLSEPNVSSLDTPLEFETISLPSPLNSNSVHVFVGMDVREQHSERHSGLCSGLRHVSGASFYALQQNTPPRA